MSTHNVSFLDFQEAFQKYFKVRGAHVVSGLADKPRNRGRWALAYTMADMGFTKGVEIGVQYGGSAELWCSTNPQLQLTGIDPYVSYRRRKGKFHQDASYETTRDFLAKYHVNLIRNTSLGAVGEFEDGSLDFVHIDGDHSFDMAMADLIVWSPKVRKGGLILAHDYSSLNWHGVSQAVHSYLFAHGINQWWATFDVSPTVFWRKP